ncbi:MAG: DNA-binding response OmpR family regulator [Yoonia sp.]|jgi:DNA-binding response OmpR family regulator
MRILIVQSNYDLGQVWARHVERLGASLRHVQTGDAALALLEVEKFDAIVLDLVLSEGSALTVADFAEFNQPAANVIFVTDTTFFSDGSIFALCANVRAFVKTTTPPDDLAAIVHHYAQTASRAYAALRSQELGSQG